MEPANPIRRAGDFEALFAENRMLRDEIRVARQAAEITAQMVVEQFEKTEAMQCRLWEANEELTAILESSMIGIALVKERVILKGNNKFHELFGYVPGELAGHSVSCLHPNKESYLAMGEGYRRLAQGERFRQILELKRRDETRFWARINGCMLSGNVARGSVWMFEDVTAEHEAQTALVQAREIAERAEHDLRASYVELEQANRRLQQLDQLKSDFLSSVSHELRTPLTSIRGFSQLVGREFGRSFAPLAKDDPGLQKKAARIEENIEIVLKESERLTRLINDVLDLAKIESGRNEWHDAPMQVEAWLQNAAEVTAGLFEEKPAVRLQLDIGAGLPSFIGDADRMLQVLVNLVSNAVKFTDSGSVGLHAFLNREGLIQVDVRDSGIGFPPEEAETIFDKFQQARQGDTLLDRPKGTGLGLAICREIIERHGGRIWAQSEPGRGSVFSLTLLPVPGSLAEVAKGVAGVTPAPDPSRAPAASDKPDRKKVLVADDDPSVCDYFAQLLQEQGYEVITAADGQAALEAARVQQPDLITMDLAMPVMDGYTAIARLRDDPVLGRIPIMVISALPGWEKAGGNLAMGKPLDEQRFVENIHLLLHGADYVRSDRKLQLLVLYDEHPAPTLMAGGYTAACDVGFCPVAELSARIRAGFQGMVVVPADLLGKVDIGFLDATPSLEVMIVPVPAAGDKAFAVPAQPQALP
ncbi:MAG: signal transduction histidine kinase [Rhodocyclaceae bacterium]|nr:signal transduction histidine kinase [Rhodocyclaceae bacterium]